MLARRGEGADQGGGLKGEVASIFKVMDRDKSGTLR